MIAMRADPLVLRQLDLVHDVAAAGTFLEEAVRDVALFPWLGFDRRFFENGHKLCACRRRGMDGTSPSFLQYARALAQSGAGGQDVVDQEHA